MKNKFLNKKPMLERNTLINALLKIHVKKLYLYKIELKNSCSF